MTDSKTKEGKLKILNLYAGIGGNRKLWDDEHDITAVELDPKIAAIYQDFFPKDNVVIADAHQYLLDHFKEFDFIWSSPPCPTHSSFAKMRSLSDDYKRGNASYETQYPDMKLYEEILLLQHHFKGKYCVENVIPYYKPLIEAQKLQRHLFWTNFFIRPIEVESDNIKKGKRVDWEAKLGLSLEGKDVGIRTDTILRNCVNPELGFHIFNEAFKNPQKQLL